MSAPIPAAGGPDPAAAGGPRRRAAAPEGPPEGPSGHPPPGEPPPDDPPDALIAPPPMLARGAAAAVLRALPGARAVGGCVRDLLAGRPVADIDVGVPMPPEAAAARLRAAGLRVAETGLAHGTVTAILDGEPVEVTALRRDLETDGRHATVAWTTDWRADAARRDFTVNSMSLAADGRLWDPFGGRADLAAGAVRFVGDPATRLREDHLRALRFFRFHARYGRGPADPAALAAIAGAVPGLARLSAERVWSELRGILATPDPAAALAAMGGTGVLSAVLPEADPARIPALAAAVAAVAAGLPPTPLPRLAAVLRDGADAAGLSARLKLSNEERLALLDLADPAAAPPPAPDDDALRRWLATRPRPALAPALAWVAQARDGADRAALRARIAAGPVPAFPLLGRDLAALGVPPGPAMGAMLAGLRDWWLAQGCRPDADACRDELRRRLPASP